MREITSNLKGGRLSNLKKINSRPGTAQSCYCTSAFTRFTKPSLFTLTTNLCAASPAVTSANGYTGSTFAPGSILSSFFCAREIPAKSSSGCGSTVFIRVQMSRASQDIYFLLLCLGRPRGWGAPFRSVFKFSLYRSFKNSGLKAAPLSSIFSMRLLRPLVVCTTLVDSSLSLLSLLLCTGCSGSKSPFCQSCSSCYAFTSTVASGFSITYSGHLASGCS